MTDEDITSHIDEIINALQEKSDKKISREEVESEFNRFMEYGVPVDQAKQTLIKKYGGTAVLTSSSSATRTLVSDLKPNEFSVKLLAHVIAINPKEITVRGEPRTIYYGILGDESGTVQFTAWNDVKLEKGDVVEISNAYTREWQGNVQLNLGDRTRIEKTDKEKLPKDAFEPRTVKINDLHSGMGRVEVTARISEINERETEIDGENKKIFSGMIEDESGKAQFTSWHDFNLREGDVFRISGGYVKTWKGIPQLTFDSNASVKKMDKKSVGRKELERVRMQLHELVEKRGALDIEIEGTIIDIRPGSGCILRCPECNRSTFDGQCSIHGEVEGVPDLRIKLVVDDGTGAVGSVLNKKLSEKILGKKLDDCKKIDNNELLDEIKTKLFTKKIVLKGNALGDNFGTSVIARDAEIVDVDVKKESERILKELEELS